MRRIITVALSMIMIISLCSCSNNSITYNDDGSEIYYNGYVYIQVNNFNGKYQVNLENEQCLEISKIPYGFLRILGANTSFYGNDLSKPDFIANNRTTDIYLREDICIDHNSTLVLKYSDVTFNFSIAENTTGEKIKYSVDEYQDYATVLDFIVSVEQIPAISMHIYIVKKDGVLFLQDCFNSDYYVINPDFLDSLNQFFLSQDR